MSNRKIDVRIKTVDGEESTWELLTQAPPVAGAIEREVMNKLYEDRAIVVYDWDGARVIIPATSIISFRLAASPVSETPDPPKD